MKLPQIQAGKVVVYRAETSTGHILNNDGSVYMRSGGENFCTVFDSINHARSYIKEYLDKDNSVEFSINDHNGEIIEVWELTNADKCIKIINSKLQKWGKSKIEENDCFKLITYFKRNKVRLFFITTGYLEYEFIFTYKDIHIYIDNDRMFEIVLDMKDVMRDNIIFEEVVDMLFLSDIKIREYVQFKSFWIYFFDKNSHLLKKIRSKKYKFFIALGKFLDIEYKPIISINH